MNYYQHTNTSYVVKFINHLGQTEESAPFCDKESALIFSLVIPRKSWVEEITDVKIPEGLLN